MTRTERWITRIIFIVCVLIVFKIIHLIHKYANKKNITSSVLIAALLITTGMSWYVMRNNTHEVDIVPTVELTKELKELIFETREQPSSISTWNKLGRAYLLEQDYEKSYQAYNQSRQLDFSVLLGDNSQLTKEKRIERLNWLAGLAEARVLAQGGAIDEESEKFLKLALSINDQHPKVLWYNGLLAAQKGEFPTAKALWMRLKEQNPPNALSMVLERRLQGLDAIMNQNSQSPVTSTADTSIPSKQEQDKNWELKLKFVVSEELRESANNNTRIFLSMRIHNSQLPPIAAKKIAIPSEDDVITFGSNDSIPMMAAPPGGTSWEDQRRLDIIWSPSGAIGGEDNIRFASLLTRANLNGINEFTLSKEQSIPK